MVGTRCIGLIALFVGLGRSPVAAQSSNAEAEALFEQGRELMAKAEYGEACSAFEASQKLDPAITTLLNLAGCREKNGQLATAWALFLDAARQARDSSAPAAQQFEKVATERSTKLATRLSKLAVKVSAPAPGLEIRRGEQVMPTETWNRSLPIDGGTFVMVVSL